MNLPVPTPEQIEEFKPIYLEVYGREPTDEEASVAATYWLQLFCLGTYGAEYHPGNRKE